MDFNDIDQLLRNGVTPEEIADAFANALNEASEAYDIECATSLTPVETLMDDMDADGYFCDDNAYFEDWGFNDYCELLSLIWNQAVIAYNRENDCNIEAYLSVPEAQSLMATAMKLTKSFDTIASHVQETTSKCRNKVSKAGDAICGCGVAGTVDEFETILKDFLKSL